MPSKTTGEHALAIVKAGLAAVPVVGGSISSLVGDYVPTHTQNAIEQAVENLAERLRTLEQQNRVDPDAVNRDEFAELFKSCYLTIVRTHQDEKLRASAALIANLFLKDDDPEKLPYTEADHFVRCVEQLSIGAISVIDQAVELAKLDRHWRDGSQSVRIEFRSLADRSEETDRHLLMGLVGELNGCNLLHIRSLPSVTTEGDDYGNYPIEVTPLGVRFVDRLLRT